MTTPIRIGLIGCGVVGRALLELLDRRRDDLAQRHGLAFEVGGIAVRDVLKYRGPLAHDLPRIDDPIALAEDPQLDMIVEVAGGGGDVAKAVKAALALGRPVVSANKALIAAELGPLVELATSHAAPFAVLCHSRLHNFRR